jgi:hypothetical protein
MRDGGIRVSERRNERYWARSLTDEALAERMETAPYGPKRDALVAEWNARVARAGWFGADLPDLPEPEEDAAGGGMPARGGSEDIEVLLAEIDRLKEAARRFLEAEAEPAYSWVVESQAARHEGRPNREIERMARVAAARRDLAVALAEADSAAKDPE